MKRHIDKIYKELPTAPVLMINKKRVTNGDLVQFTALSDKYLAKMYWQANGVGRAITWRQVSPFVAFRMK